MNNICRLCAKVCSQRLQHRLTQDGYPQKLIRCFQLDLTMEQDILPQTACRACIAKLDEFWQFIQQVNDSQRELYKLFSAQIKLERSDELEEQRFCVETEGQEEFLSSKNTQTNLLPIKKRELDSDNSDDAGFDIEITDDHRSDVSVSPVPNDLVPIETKIEPPQSQISSITNNHPVDTPELKISDTNKAPKRKKKVNESNGIKKKYDFIKLLKSLENSDCQADGTITEEALARLRLTTWKDYRWKCWKCSELFDDENQLQSHVNGWHEDHKPMMYACSICSRKCSRRPDLINHVAAIHEPHLKKCCNVCSAFFWDTKSMWRHRRTHVGPNDEQYICDHCGKICISLSSLSQHQLIHFAGKYICDVCEKAFKTKSSVKEHLILKHTTERPYQCETCGLAFKLSLKLKKHERTHVDLMPFRCPYNCGRQFRTNQRLSHHILIHTGEMPHKCSYCGKQFRLQKFLKEHIRLHTGEKPFGCPKCNKRFSNYPNYLKHVRHRSSVCA